MKLYSLIKILITFIFLFIFNSCTSESKKYSSELSFVNLNPEGWSESAKNMYKIHLSMRKIDSLSADLNLKFTRKYAQDL